MKTIDLSKVKIEMLDSSIVEYDISKELAEAIFHNTQSIPEHIFSLELYKNPIIELNEEKKQIIEKYIALGFKAFVQVAVNKLINE